MMNNSKVALVTGANKGIGLEIARQLGQQGMTVLLGARDAARGIAAANALREVGLDAHFVQIDVTDVAQIAALPGTLEADYGCLDILVNNAGIALDDSPPSQVSLDIVRRTYEVNVFGVIAVTQALLPMLRRSEAARIVNLSSGLGSLARQSDPQSQFAEVNLMAYNSSKTALNAITVQFATEFRDTAIKINAACPGYTATDLNQNRGTRTVAQAATVVVHLATLPADGPTGGYFDENGPVPW
jgi:NAD(P)-dependent dehydrogenase (short-subunit alcohol dehydrogenase family)